MKNRLQELAGITEALPRSGREYNVMMKELSELLQLLSDIDIDKAMQLDSSAVRTLTNMSSAMNKFLKGQSKVLGK